MTSQKSAIYQFHFHCLSTQIAGRDWRLLQFLKLFFSPWSLRKRDCLVAVFLFLQKHHHHHKSIFGQTGLSAIRELFGDVLRRAAAPEFCFVKDTLIFCFQNLMVQSQMRVLIFDDIL